MTPCTCIEDGKTKQENIIITNYAIFEYQKGVKKAGGVFEYQKSLKKSSSYRRIDLWGVKCELLDNNNTERLFISFFSENVDIQFKISLEEKEYTKIYNELSKAILDHGIIISFFR